MKVAMLTTVGDRCGIAVYTRDLLRSLEDRVEVTVEPIDVGKQSADHYRDQAERLNAADVIHVQHEHSFWGGILPGRSAFWELRRLLHKPVVLTAHSTYSLAQLLRIRDERRPFHAFAKRLLVLLRGYRTRVEIAPFDTGHCIVHTEEARRALIERGAGPRHVHVVPAGVPAPLPSPSDGAQFRRRFHLEGRRVITLFGFIAPNKGYELTLQILPHLPPEVVFVIAGGARTAADEPYERCLRDRIEAEGLAERVRITGFLPDAELAGAMAASEIVLTPHTQATGSYSVMVSLSYGKPVVASDLATFRELADRGSGIRLFRCGDASEFLARVKSVLGDPGLRQDLGVQALKYAGHHPWAKVARRTVGVYEAALRDATRLACARS